MKDSVKRTSALVLSWPDARARGDDGWYKTLYNLGVFKHLHFKVGHAAILLVDPADGHLHYFDFGRYIAPRGYGRVRCAGSDPHLEMEVKARRNEKGDITNLEEIAEQLETKSLYTHGEGKLVFSVSQGLDFDACMKYARQLYSAGLVEYGAVARGNTNCSRFVSDVVRSGLPRGSARRIKLRWPESIMASTLGTVVNATSDVHAYVYSDGKLEKWKINRKKALGYLLGNLTDNLKGSKCPHERSVEGLRPGFIRTPERHPGVPPEAHWLGGVGEGAWHRLSPLPEAGTRSFRLQRFHHKHGECEFDRVFVDAGGEFVFQRDWEFGYPTHRSALSIRQQGRDFAFELVGNYKEQNIAEDLQKENHSTQKTEAEYGLNNFEE